MDAVEFLKEWKRMCKANTIGEPFWTCCNGNCGLLEVRNARKDSCRDTVLNKIGESVIIVEKCSETHKSKTRKKDFQEKYPKAEYKMDGIGTPNICCKKLGYTDCCPTGKNCVECWNEPVE